MAATGKQIIASVIKDYPPQSQAAISNCMDLDIEARYQLFNQYILGVTLPDQISIDINQYRYRMRDVLNRPVDQFKCLGWSYSEDELEEMKAALQELSDYFNAGADVKRTMEKVAKGDSHWYFIVVTVVPVQLLYAG